MEIIWDEVFTNKDFDYETSYPNLSKEEIFNLAVSDGLMGWGNAMSGLSDIPENFGIGMGKINKITGAVTPQDIDKLARNIIKEDNETIIQSR